MRVVTLFYVERENLSGIFKFAAKYDKLRMGSLLINVYVILNGKSWDITVYSELGYS